MDGVKKNDVNLSELLKITKNQMETIPETTSNISVRPGYEKMIEALKKPVEQYKTYGIEDIAKEVKETKGGLGKKILAALGGGIKFLNTSTGQKILSSLIGDPYISRAYIGNIQAKQEQEQQQQMLAQQQEEERKKQLLGTETELQKEEAEYGTEMAKEKERLAQEKPMQDLLMEERKVRMEEVKRKPIEDIAKQLDPSVQPIYTKYSDYFVPEQQSKGLKIPFIGLRIVGKGGKSGIVQTKSIPFESEKDVDVMLPKGTKIKIAGREAIWE